MPKGKPLVKKKKPVKPTLKIKGAINDDGQIGHDHRLAAFVLRAVQLKRLDYFHHQIARVIADEFQLESIPAINTVAYWLQKSYGEIGKDITTVQDQMRMDTLIHIDKMIAKWSAIALADELHVMRWKMMEGEMQPFMDENATAEQLEATKVVIKLIERKCRLLGLDMEKATTATGEGPQNLLELQLWMIGQVNVIAGTGGEIDVNHKTLEIKSGIPEIDTDSI